MLHEDFVYKGNTKLHVLTNHIMLHQSLTSH